MKILYENIFEFKKGLDPVDSLGLGRRALIEDWLKNQLLDCIDIKKCTVNDDFTIDVDDSVYFNALGWSEFPDYIQFGTVTGFFDISDNKFTSLRGCPKKVYGFFSCDNNNLTSLEYCPLYVGGDFTCKDNLLKSLKGCPKEIFYGFNCSLNNLKSLKYAPQQVNLDFICGHNDKQFKISDVNKVCDVGRHIFV